MSAKHIYSHDSNAISWRNGLCQYQQPNNYAFWTCIEEFARVASCILFVHYHGRCALNALVKQAMVVVNLKGITLLQDNSQHIIN